MGGKSSKPVTGENGVITYKVDVYGANIRQKFDSGTLEISEEQVTFTGPKATFKWPIKELKRYGSAKKVFTIEINEHNEQLDSREIKFKTKYADSIYEQFKNKVGEMENEAKGEGGEEKKADAANAITDDAKAAEPEKTNGSVQKASDKDDAKTDNEGKESGKTSPNAAGMTLTTNPTITVQTPSPTTERAGSGPTTPAEGDKEEPEQKQETPEPAASEGETKETAASPEEKPSESPEPETKEAAPAPAETPEPEPVPEPEASENQEETPASPDVAPEPEAEPVTTEEPAPSVEEPAPSVEEPASSVEEPAPSAEEPAPEPVIEEPASPAAENHTAQEPEDAEKTCSEEAATAVTNHGEETPADPPAAEEEVPAADNQEAEAPAAENGPSESQDAE